MRIRRKKEIKLKRVTVGDIGITYLIKEATAPPDEAKTIVFIHGFPFNKDMWIGQLEALPENITGIAIDVRGHGSSTMGHGFFSLDLFAGDLIEFLRKKEIEKAIICGVSMGGYIALRAHELAPQKFTALILSDTNSIADNNDTKTKRFSTIRSVLQHGTRTFSISFAKQVFSEYSLSNRREAFELIKNSIHKNNVRSICATLLALASRRATTDHLKNIKIPTLLTWGREDQDTPLEQGKMLEKHIPGAKLVVFEQCGHLPNLEDTEAFNKTLLAFIEKV